MVGGSENSNSPLVSGFPDPPNQVQEPMGKNQILRNTKRAFEGGINNVEWDDVSCQHMGGHLSRPYLKEVWRPDLGLTRPQLLLDSYTIIFLVTRPVIGLVPPDTRPPYDKACNEVRIVITLK